MAFELISFAYIFFIPSNSYKNLIGLSPLAERASTIVIPSNFSSKKI